MTRITLSLPRLHRRCSDVSTRPLPRYRAAGSSLTDAKAAVESAQSEFATLTAA